MPEAEQGSDHVENSDPNKVIIAQHSCHALSCLQGTVLVSAHKSVCIAQSIEACS